MFCFLFLSQFSDCIKKPSTSPVQCSFFNCIWGGTSLNTLCLLGAFYPHVYHLLIELHQVGEAGFPFIANVLAFSQLIGVLFQFLF